jgi:nitrogen fixation protein FixH
MTAMTGRDQDPGSEPSPKASARRWIAFIVALLVAPMVVTVVLVARVAQDPSFAVEPDYYQRSLAWDEVMAQERRNVELGWSLYLVRDPRAVPPGGVSPVEIGLSDRGGHPLDGATIRVEAFHNARAAEVLAATLAPRGSGRYLAALPIHRPGLWELRFTVQARGAFHSLPARGYPQGGG